MSFVSNIVGGVLGAIGGSKAAGAGEQGAKQAQNLLNQNQQNALNFQTNEWTGQQANQNPFLSAGQTAVGQLSNMATDPGTFNYGQTFHAPTAAEAEATPGFQFTMQQGQNAINSDAAARGTLLSGNTGVALQNYGQGLASNTYQQTYNNALNTYGTNYNQWQQALQNRLGTLGALTNTGQVAANALGQEGQAAANNISNVDLTGGQQQAQQINNAAAARASAYLAKYGGISRAASGGMQGLSDLFAMA